MLDDEYELANRYEELEGKLAFVSGLVKCVVLCLLMRLLLRAFKPVPKTCRRHVLWVNWLGCAPPPTHTPHSCPHPQCLLVYGCLVSWWVLWWQALLVHEAGPDD